jgi:TusA-related sulfurtransferase
MEIKKLDLRGQMCPSALLTALREINMNKVTLKAGNMNIAILTDNRDSTITIPESVVRMGYEAHVTKEEEYYRIDIRTANG